MAWAAPAGVSEEEKVTGSDGRRLVGRCFAMMRHRRLRLVATFVVMVLTTLTVLAGPALIGYGIDHGIKAHRSGPLDKAALAYLVIAVAAVFLSRAQIRMITWLGEGFLRDLRVRVFDHIQAMPMAFFDGEQTGRLVSRMTADVNALEDLVQQGLLLFVTNGLLIVVAVVVLIVMSPMLFALSLVSLPAMAVATRRFRRDSNTAYLRVRDRISQTLSSLQEGLSGVRVIQAFGKEEHQERRFSTHNRAQLDANIDAVRISVRYFPVVEMSGVVTTAALVGVGGWLVSTGAVQLGVVVAFVLYLANLFDPIQQMSQLFNLVQSAGAALSKLFALLDTASTLTESPDAVELPAHGPVEVRGVSFAYGASSSARGPLVLRDVTITVVPGEHLALVGPTGAGKSTLAKLMTRLYDPVEGAVHFGGTDLRLATFDSLRRRMVVVPQEGFLFSGTLFDNVRLGRAGATDAEVRDALALVGAADRFEAFPDGLGTEVRERGSRLSAGERQLVSLARAALANPEVLVLDEATSSLDPGTEAEVEAAVGALMAGRTVVVIAHRLSTAERADRVAVVDDGCLTELGTHDELLGRGGRYAALFAVWSKDQPGSGRGLATARPG